MNHTGTSGRSYRTGTLTLPQQLLVARKIGAVIPVVQPMTAKANADKDKTLLALMLLGNLPDDAATQVQNVCLGVVTTADVTGTFVKLVDPGGGIMFQDVTVQDLFALTAKVIEENLGDFFRTALGSLEAAAAT